MNTARENCIILLVEAPVPELVSPALTGAFGAERAVRIHLDLIQNAYKLVKNFGNAIPILAYEKSARHPDLTWLDADDPGFLNTKGKGADAGIANGLRLAFNTGAKKALLLSHMSPGVKPEWLQLAFDSISDKTISVGPNTNGSMYLVGLTVAHLDLLEGSFFASSKGVLEFSEKAKKNKLSVCLLPEACAVDSEETLRAWRGTGTTPGAQAAPIRPDQNHTAGTKHAKRGNKHCAPQQPPPVSQEPLP